MGRSSSSILTRCLCRQARDPVMTPSPTLPGAGPRYAHEADPAAHLHLPPQKPSLCMEGLGWGSSCRAWGGRPFTPGLLQMLQMRAPAGWGGGAETLGTAQAGQPVQNRSDGLPFGPGFHFQGQESSSGASSVGPHSWEPRPAPRPSPKSAGGLSGTCPRGQGHSTEAPMQSKPLCALTLHAGLVLTPCPQPTGSPVQLDTRVGDPGTHMLLHTRPQNLLRTRGYLCWGGSSRTAHTPRSHTQGLPPWGTLTSLGSEWPATI